MDRSKNKNKVKCANGTIGEKLRQYRKKKCLTQEQLAELVDIDAKYLARLEKDMHNPTFNVMKKLAQVLGFDMSVIEETPIEKIATPGKYFSKAIQILNSVKSDEDMKLYLEALKHTEKCLKSAGKQ